MELTVIGKLPKTGTSTGVKVQQDAGMDFSSVMGKVLNSGGGTNASQRVQSTKSGKTNSTKPGGQKEKDAVRDGENTDFSLAVDVQALTGTEQIAVQGTTAGVLDTAQSTVPTGGSREAQTAQTAAAAALSEMPAEPAAILTPETFTANVKVELRQSANDFQAQMQQASQTPLAEQTLQPERTVQAAQAAQTVSQTGTVPQTAAKIGPFPADNLQKTLKAAGETEISVQQPEEAMQSAIVKPQAEAAGDTSAQSGESDLTGAAKQESAETKKTDGTKTASPQFSTAAAHAAAQAQTQETADLQKAVNRALVQFDQDFQGMRGDAKNLQISLHPKELGSVSISLAAGTSGVTAKIQTSSAEAASLLSAQVQRMVESMEAKGVRVQNVEVVLTQTPQQDGGNNGGNAQQQYQSSSNRIYEAQAVTADKSTALGDYERMTETYADPLEDGQCVEYRV